MTPLIALGTFGVVAARTCGRHICHTGRAGAPVRRCAGAPVRVTPFANGATTAARISAGAATSAYFFSASTRSPR
ncbi:hypothetical protein [Streptomyces sp. NPDC007206]|uniref:hypothetical protein n=1 Tax=Streptomyces sp. NPDC007206 TaxID=3154317 RepID=UPI0033D3CA0B